MRDRPPRIAGYCRISVDDDLDSDNVSIENQKAIIADYVQTRFPESALTFFEDRDMSGYTFTQRTAYQNMKRALIAHEYDILIVKDFSRFGRRNSLGLVELEQLRDCNVRVISIGDGVDYPTNNDWLMIQFRFLMNEIPVTETSKKIRDVIRRRQKDAKWITSAPYGYFLHPTQKNTICIDKEGAQVVSDIFRLYNAGWGYKRIANYLTERGAPTALELTKRQMDQRGADSSKVKPNPVWSPISVSHILKNDFYIGTLRQNVWTRAGINKKDVRVPPEKQLVFENHHEPIVECSVFEKAQENFHLRSVRHYKGMRKYEIPYSGVLFCGDCGAHMFSHSQPHRPAGYVCGTYHRMGRRGCTSHHIHESVLNDSVKSYITSVRDNLKEALVRLDVEKSRRQIEENKGKMRSISEKIDSLKRELRETTRQRIRQTAANPADETLIAETFDTLEKEYLTDIRRLTQQSALFETESKQKSQIKKNISSVLDLFDTLLKKETFTREDISLMIGRITVEQDKTLTIELKSDISELFSIV